MFLWLNGRHDKAREYVDRMLKMSQTSREGLTLRGWVDLTSGRDTMIKNSIKYFEDALSGLVEKLTDTERVGKYLVLYGLSLACVSLIKGRGRGRRFLLTCVMYSM